MKQAKDDLILSIVKVASGEEAPAEATNRGAPPKAKKIEAAELTEFMELFRDETEKDVVLKLTGKEFEYFAEMIYLGNFVVRGYQNEEKITEDYCNAANKVFREYYTLGSETEDAGIKENDIEAVLKILSKNTKKYVERFEKEVFAKKLSEMLKEKIEDFLLR